MILTTTHWVDWMRAAMAATAVRLAAAALAVTLVMAPAADAQVLYGTITGTVTDSTGGALRGATVVAINVETGVTKETVTDARGAFLFSDLTPGVYDVSIELSGFKGVMQRGVRIESNSVRRLEVPLEVSGVQESIQVSAAAMAIQTDRADVHITQTSKEVNDLPLVGSLGRNYQSLMQIVPGAAITRTENGQGEANSVAGSPQRSISFNANGVSSWQNQTKIDGSPVQYVWLPTNTAYVPSPEAIEEVSIVTNSYTAEVGTAGGAAINVVVKSGTNTFRGTGWYYETDSDWRARNVFQTTPTNPKSEVRQYGANTGGRIIKDKLFFFFNAEKSEQRTAPGTRLLSIAPENLRPNSA